MTVYNNQMQQRDHRFKSFLVWTRINEHVVFPLHVLFISRLTYLMHKRRRLNVLYPSARSLKTFRSHTDVDVSEPINKLRPLHIINLGSFLQTFFASIILCTAKKKTSCALSLAMVKFQTVRTLPQTDLV